MINQAPKQRGIFFERDILRKRSNRTPRPATIPTIAFMHTIPEAEIALLTALDAFVKGWASPNQFDALLDTRDLLVLAATAKRDEGVIAVCNAANIALGNIRETWDGEKFATPTEDELNALRFLADVSTDFWKRQSGALYQAAYAHLKQWRDTQGSGKNEDQRNEN